MSVRIIETGDHRRRRLFAEAADLGLSAILAADHDSVGRISNATLAGSKLMEALLIPRRPIKR